MKALSLEFAPEYIESTFKCIDHLGKLGNYTYQLSMGESMEFYLPDWVTAEKAKEQLRKVPTSSCGDIYARLS